MFYGKNFANETTDGMAAFTRIKKGSQSKVTERAPPIEFIHHIIYRETAAANK